MPHESTPYATEPETGSVKTLLQELRAEATELLHKEVELAKAELSERTSRLGGHVTRIGVGGFIAYAGALVLLIGLSNLVTALLTQAGVEPLTANWIGPIAIGLLVAIIGWSMLARARRAVKSDTLVPEQTIQSLRENKQWMQTKLQHSHESV